MFGQYDELKQKWKQRKKCTQFRDFENVLKRKET